MRTRLWIYPLVSLMVLSVCFAVWFSIRQASAQGTYLVFKDETTGTLVSFLKFAKDKPDTVVVSIDDGNIDGDFKSALLRELLDAAYALLDDPEREMKIESKMEFDDDTNSWCTDLDISNDREELEMNAAGKLADNNKIYVQYVRFVYLVNDSAYYVYYGTR